MPSHEAPFNPDLHALEVSLRSLIDTQNEKHANDMHETRKAIAQLTDLILARYAPGEGSGNHSSTGDGGGKGNFQLSTRLTKVDFHRFDGDDFKSWLYRCEQYFSLDEVNDEAKVKLAAIHMEGMALQWHQGYMKSRGYALPGWGEYVMALTARFGALYDDPMTDLKNLRQNNSVQEYQDAFDAIVNRLDLGPSYALSCFLAGLDDEIQLNVRMFNPKTLRHAYFLA